MERNSLVYCYVLPAVTGLVIWTTRCVGKCIVTPHQLNYAELRLGRIQLPRERDFSLTILVFSSSLLSRLCAWTFAIRTGLK